MIAKRRWRAGVSSLLLFASAAALARTEAVPAATSAEEPDAYKVSLHWGLKIPMRDGVKLAGTLYQPRNQTAPSPCLILMTPYIAQTNHKDAVYFAARGYPAITVDVRGRGNSDGEFKTFQGAGFDAGDVVRWAARQPWCDGRVAMWGGSYPGYLQWAAALDRPDGLATIIPVASPYPGLDFPARAGIPSTDGIRMDYNLAGRTAQPNILLDNDLWNGFLKRRFENGETHRSLAAEAGLDDSAVGNPPPYAYWRNLAPTDAGLSGVNIPVLSITGAYDATQWGTIAFYRQHMRTASPEGRRNQYLVIGPWDHPATRTPRQVIGGLQLGHASMVDLQRLHFDWYEWVFKHKRRPEFLAANVAYYVTGAELWRYADSLDEVTTEKKSWYLHSSGSANRLISSGLLSTVPASGKPDRYVYDPHDISAAKFEVDSDPGSLTDSGMIEQSDGKALFYSSSPFTEATEIAGFFKFDAWLAINQPDTDFRVAVYDLAPDGSRVLLASDLKRARYREGLQTESIVRTMRPLLYHFDGFNFVARLIAPSHRLQLTIGPINSMRMQKNYNAAKPVADQSIEDARTVAVSLFHDISHPSVLIVPFGHGLER